MHVAYGGIYYGKHKKAPMVGIRYSFLSVWGELFGARVRWWGNASAYIFFWNLASFRAAGPRDGGACRREQTGW